MVQGPRDPLAAHYLPVTLKYALLKRFTVLRLESNPSMTTESGVLPRSEELVTQEGHLTRTVTYPVQNPR